MNDGSSLRIRAEMCGSEDYLCYRVVGHLDMNDRVGRQLFPFLRLVVSTIRIVEALVANHPDEFARLG